MNLNLFDFYESLYNFCFSISQRKKITYKDINFSLCLLEITIKYYNDNPDDEQIKQLYKKIFYIVNRIIYNFEH